MLIEVVISRLELKTLFVSEYEKLIKAEESISKNVVKNNLAESLKYNLRIVNEMQNSGGVEMQIKFDRINKPVVKDDIEEQNESEL